jgi:endonuclease/exonuclease/phosphatase family metal-dependent hydrolase
MEIKTHPLNQTRSPKSLSVLTWNCQGLPCSRRDRRFPLLAKKIEALAPDVVFLQEIVFSGDEKFFRLEGYHRSFVPRGPVLHGGLMTLCREPMRDAQFVPFARQGAWHNLQVTDRLLGKGFLEVEVPGWGLHLLNTHLVSTYQERVFQEDANQAAQLHQLLENARRKAGVLMGGDFNFMAGTPYHARVEMVLEDVTRGLHPMGLADCQPKIDHVFIGGLDWHESRCRFVPPGSIPAGGRSVALSDHAGVLVSVRLEAEEMNRSDPWSIRPPEGIAGDLVSRGRG